MANIKKIKIGSIEYDIKDVVSGYITGINSSDVTTALGYTPYDASNPNGYTSNTGTVTSVNNVSPVAGNVILSIPTDTNDLTNGAGYITSSALNNYVTTNTVQQIISAKSIVGTDAVSGDSTQANIFSALSTQSSTQPDSWKGRMMVGAKNVTFLMGAFNGMAGLGAHSWTDSASGSGAAWDNVYINPDGDKAVYIGGYAWRKAAGWFRVQNTGGNSGGTVQVNKGTISSADWKDVAYKGENISDFNNNSGYITSSALNGYATETWVGQQGYLTGITSSDVTTALGYTPLQNTATGTDSLTISGTASTVGNSTNVGYLSQATSTNTAAFGRYARATNGGSSAFGASSNASGAYSVAMGSNATASAAGAIMLGGGANSEEKTFKVALKKTSAQATDEASGLFKLLDSDGTIPAGRLPNAITSTQVTIATTDWSSNTCTKNVTGVTATSDVFVAPAPTLANIKVYSEANVFCSAIGSGTVTFTCETTPTTSLTVNIGVN
jgi:hypothetical protein